MASTEAFRAGVSAGQHTSLRQLRLPTRSRACYVWDPFPFPYKNLYNSFVAPPKPVRFLGSSLDDLRSFPEDARREAGYQIHRIQHGREPSDWKPMPAIGPGLREIRIGNVFGAFRVVYVAKFVQAVYVLHCFQKKTQRTSRTDLELAQKRYRELLRELQE